MIRQTNWKVAMGHLPSRVKQVLVAVLSVTFGISMYIFMNGFMTGVNDIQAELAFSTLAHIRIFNDLPEDNTNLLYDQDTPNRLINLRHPKVIQYAEGMVNADATIHKVLEVEGVREVTPQVNMNVFFRNGSTKVNGLLAGVEATKEQAMFGTAQSMKEGHWLDLDYRSDGIILGVGLAKKLSLGMDDIVLVSTSDGVSRNFKVIGLLETTLASVDNSKAFVRINSARQLVSENRSYATDVQINVDDYDEARRIASWIEPLTRYKVESWNDANGQLEAGNDLRNYLAIAVSLTILLVAGFGIYNIMNMTVNEKIKEIAILKAMGFEGRDIVEIFLVQSILIGLLGGLFGLFLGYVVSSIINQIPFQVASIQTLPMAYHWTDYMSAFFFGLMTTIIAGLLPAIKASKVDPVEIIRG